VAGAAVLIPDADYTPDRTRSAVVPLLADTARLERMRQAAAVVGTRAGTENVIGLIDGALGR
jgi:UDP-N-acetylglucosamine--N-acetylmuramyl-(pentapeptide) pyrophosphoryl-undecaprenol N-acetylglucosamine transferase